MHRVQKICAQLTEQRCNLCPSLALVTVLILVVWKVHASSLRAVDTALVQKPADQVHCDRVGVASMADLAEGVKGNVLVADMFLSQVAKQPHETMIVFKVDSSLSKWSRFDQKCSSQSKSYSWAEMDAASNRIAHFLLKNTLTAGDALAIVMNNRPGTFQMRCDVFAALSVCVQSTS